MSSEVFALPTGDDEMVHQRFGYLRQIHETV